MRESPGAPQGIRKVLVIASCLPPMVSGSSKMMRNLFGAFTRGTAVFLRGNNPMFRFGQEDALVPVEVADLPLLLRRRHFRVNLPKWLEYVWVPAITRRAVGIARREKVGAIFVNYPFGYFLLAGWLASRVTGLPLFVYMHDLWEETSDAAADRIMAKVFERRIMRDAAKVYAITEAAADHYRAKHGIAPGVLPHTVNLKDGEAGPSPAPRREGERLILFTGGVYNMNRDALQALVRTVEGMRIAPGETPIRLLLCTPNDPGPLARMGIAGARTQVRFVDTATAMRLQREADLLYLPLAFDTPWQDEIRTVFPTKAVEYLVSGTPILLHAPAHCYTVQDARRFGWAHVVDTLDQAAIESAIRRLLDDAGMREKLVEGARAAADSRDAEKVAAELRRDLGLA